ncbi:tetratricopeptide repeat protein [Pseudohalioglobus sediminis]|uniref:Tetratricopeptide repeat protein n=1 Tax=Pseudohalioglobus sediminis TaxID=2606449 RepID=A0A5B0X188_9GAMM|nr:tetratricopeptide repeat protein [Pseudohalioglobus sediminis]KAA1192388.1 tetratricopeptide repeat protein [Pseudohalioglobus sediminis]
MRPLSICVLSAALAGCGVLPELPGFGGSQRAAEPTLADLPPPTLTPTAEQVPERSLVDLEAAYGEVLAVTGDPALQLQVRRRLADLRMLAAEAEQTDAAAAGRAYADAIAQYQALLRDYPGVEGSDQLLYQLARAHDLEGRADRAVEIMTQLSEDYPASEHSLEAEFRKADAWFAAADYANAAQAYRNVAEGGASGEYYVNSLYMLGWSRYKQNRDVDAIVGFSLALDALVSADSSLQALPRGDREIARDCFRVLAVIFDSRGGGAAIAETYAQLGERSYQPQIYDALGRLYLQQERYQDSAQTYVDFINAYPDSPQAHVFQQNVIEVYEAAGFAEQVIAAKQAYVSLYSVDQGYWHDADDASRAVMGPRLMRYIDELARHYHALAQVDEAADAAVLYQQAASYYQLYVQSFPDEPQVADMLFLLAESYEALGEYAAAISAYQQMAYGYPSHPAAPEAAYASILAYNEMAPKSADERLAMIDNQLRFSLQFRSDPRAPLVLANAASALLAAGLPERAVQASLELVAWEPAPEVEVLQTAWLVQGQAAFDAADYASAESAYQSALALLPEGDRRRTATGDRLAASIYRQGEAAASAGEYALAAAHFARVIDTTPASSIRPNAQFDAASYYRQAGDYAQANALLLDFRQRYPQHALTAGIGALLVEHYETAGQWRLAATELDRISASENDPATRREALYLAADYYQRSGDTEAAIARYREYAHKWITPMPQRIEAMHELVELYAGQQDFERRNYWLLAQADAHDAGGGEQSERSLYLAASAMSALADWHYQRYRAVALTEPLQASLRRKRQAMADTIKAYERTNAYGVQEFGTRATYRLGRVYRQLAEALLASPRPAGLDALALEQYELLLEEQAWPFEEQAVAIFETNARRAWQGLYDPWIKQSFEQLAELMPARWGKQEERIVMSGEIY